MKFFASVNDETLVQRIRSAKRRLVFVAPAVSRQVGAALADRFRAVGKLSVTIILDPDEEPYRLGFGHIEGLTLLRQAADEHQVGLRSQSGLRFGLLISDDRVTMWSPTAASVDSPRPPDEPNGVELGDDETPISDGTTPELATSSDADEEPFEIAPHQSLSDRLSQALAADDSRAPVEAAEIGRQALTPKQFERTRQALTDNPPAPFDLARKTRVFSTRYQFVEPEMRGSAWTKREITLSNFLLNSDLPPELQDLLETRVKPFAPYADVRIAVPALVQGQLAYNARGEAITAPMSQSELAQAWKQLLARYIIRLEGFGSLIERRRKTAFEAEVAAFEQVLKRWVQGFSEVVAGAEDTLVGMIVDSIVRRVEISTTRTRLSRDQIEGRVVAGFGRLRKSEPKVKLIFKDIAWESTRDEEFTQKLWNALPPSDRAGWFRTFIAAPECEEPATCAI